MITVNYLKLTDIAAKSTLNDRTTKWIYESIDYCIQKENEKIKERLNVLDRIHYLQEREIELLLWEFHVDSINESTTLEEKRLLIIQSLLSHMKKGTLGAVKKLCDSIFGNSESEEWYKYDGEAGKFKVKTTADTSDPKIYKKMTDLIENIKNVRSHLDSISYVRENNVKYNYGIGTVINNSYVIEIGG